MGNQQSQPETVQPTMSRSSSGADLKDKTPTQLVPIDKLAKILTQKSVEEDGIQGISCRVFTKYVFPKYPDLSQKVFKYLHSCAESKREWLGQTGFKQQAEKLLGVIADDQQIKIFITMYAENGEIKSENFRELLLQANKLAMDHYPDKMLTCPRLYQTVQAVADSAFHRKSAVSVSYLTHWIESHCPRLLVSLFRYVVHVLSTAYRSLGEQNTAPMGLDLSTPVLEREFSFSAKQETEEMLPLSEVWLLSSALPHLYIKPSPHQSPTASNGLTSQNYIAKLLGSLCPSHWVLLYNSDHHGLGVNRFMHHILKYRGPTLTFIRGEQGVQFCIAASSEWKESNHYWGDEDCMVLQMLPLYHIMDRGSKLLYFNSAIRGYPLGVRAGLDPRKPQISINEGFTQVQHCGIPYQLLAIEVWGCGPQQLRDAQLEVKKWEVKQAEKQRKVKLSAQDWLDHPDRHLLELAGRTSYNNTSS